MQQFERKFGKRVNEYAKKLGLKSLMPKEMFGENGNFRGKKLGTYQDLRKAILQYLEDKPMPTPGTRPAELQHVGDIEKNEESKVDDYEDMMAFVRSSMGKSYGKGYWNTKGGGKGDSGSSGGKGKGKVECFNCGGDHYARDCPQAGKGSTPYGGNLPPRTCYNC